MWYNSSQLFVVLYRLVLNNKKMKKTENQSNKVALIFSF